MKKCNCVRGEYHCEVARGLWAEVNRAYESHNEFQYKVALNKYYNHLEKSEREANNA